MFFYVPHTVFEFRSHWPQAVNVSFPVNLCYQSRTHQFEASLVTTCSDIQAVAKEAFALPGDSSELLLQYSGCERQVSEQSLRVFVTRNGVDVNIEVGRPPKRVLLLPFTSPGNATHPNDSGSTPTVISVSGTISGRELRKRCISEIGFDCDRHLESFDLLLHPDDCELGDDIHIDDIDATGEILVHLQLNDVGIAAGLDSLTKPSDTCEVRYSLFATNPSTAF